VGTTLAPLNVESEVLCCNGFSKNVQIIMQFLCRMQSIIAAARNLGLLMYFSLALVAVGVGVTVIPYPMGTRGSFSGDKAAGA
jgi:hypothetical protein